MESGQHSIKSPGPVSPNVMISPFNAVSRSEDCSVGGRKSELNSIEGAIPVLLHNQKAVLDAQLMRIRNRRYNSCQLNTGTHRYWKSIISMKPIIKGRTKMRLVECDVLMVQRVASSGRQLALNSYAKLSANHVTRATFIFQRNDN